MEGQELADRFKLDITVLSNYRSKEVVLKPSAGQRLKQERLVIIWTRKYDLTERVFVEESPHGELRVVKRVAWRDKSVVNYRSELDVLGRLSKATGYVSFLITRTSGALAIKALLTPAIEHKRSSSSTS